MYDSDFEVDQSSLLANLQKKFAYLYLKIKNRANREKSIGTSNTIIAIIEIN